MEYKSKGKNKISFLMLKEMLKNSIRLMSLIWKEKKGWVLALIFLFILSSASPFLRSGSRGLVINELSVIFGKGEITSNLLVYITLMILALFIPSFLYVGRSYVAKLFWFFLEEKFELMIVKKKSEIDIASHENPKQKDLFNRVTEGGIWRVINFVDRQFYIFQSITEVIIASIIIAFNQWWVFFVILLGTLPELIFEISYGRQVWSIQEVHSEARRRFWDIRWSFNEISSLVELKIFQNSQHFISLLKDLFRSFKNEEKKNEKRRFFLQLIAVIFSQGVTAFAAVYFIIQVTKGNILIGTLTFILASIGDLRQSLSTLFMYLGRQYEDNLFVSDVFRFLGLKPELQSPQKGIILDFNKSPEIVFEKVSFSYPNTTKKILKNFSVRIAPGERLALVGINGAGKTTFVKLLCRFYDPTEGRILINGHDLKDVDIDSWYNQLGVIFQDYFNYRFLAKEVVALGRTSVPVAMDKVKKAAKASEANVFIEEWEKKYEQMLGREYTGGLEPSIGQWQKLALARSFYRDPKVLILDEPTSSIDAEAEAKIFARLEKMPKDHTIILISHRFSTVRQADKIGVIENGELKEYGTHEELLKLKGIYARLFTIQAKGYR